MRLGCGLWGVSILHVISFIEIKLHFYSCDVIGDTKQLNMRIIANTEPRHLSVCVSAWGGTLLILRNYLHN